MRISDWSSDVCSSDLPPFTLLSALSRGGRALAINIGAAVLLTLGALAMIRLTGAALQWWCIAFGYYAVFSWAGSLKRRDAPTFRLIWGSKAFLATILGYGTVAFMSYASSAFAPGIGRASCRERVCQSV